MRASRIVEGEVEGEIAADRSAGLRHAVLGQEVDFPHTCSSATTARRRRCHARRRSRPQELLHDSDQGSQYTSDQFQRLMDPSGVVCSMSRSGNCWDNAAREIFLSSLKTERTARKIYRTRDQAKADVFDYIERF